MFDAR